SGLVSVPESNVTAQHGAQVEGTIAIDPANSNRVFAAGENSSLADQRLPGLAVATSDDGGGTWHPRPIAAGPGPCPPASRSVRATFDQFGNLFVTYVGTNASGEIVLLVSTDGGSNFRVLREFDDSGVDMPSLAAGPGTGGIGGSVWLTWIEQDGVRAAG